MSTDSWLELRQPESIACTNSHLAKLALPSHIPQRLYGCSKTFNTAMIVGSALGLDDVVATLGDVLDGLDCLPDDIPHLFLEEDLKETFVAISEIRVKLKEVIDDEGRPRIPKGTHLIEDKSLRKDLDGFIYAETGHMFLGELLQNLEVLSQFFQYALNNQLLVEKERVL